MSNFFKTFENIDFQKNYEVTFINPEYYVSDRTIEAFVRRLKKLDKSLQYDSTKNGKVQNGRIIYIKSLLTPSDINDVIKNFIPNYEFLRVQLVTKR